VSVYVATTSFVWRDRYLGNVEIVAGQTYVSDEADILRDPQARQNFRPSSRGPLGRPATRVGGIARVTPRPPTSRGRSRPVVASRAHHPKRSACRHEAAHAAAAHLLGWEVTGIEVYRDGAGVTNVLAPRGLAKDERAGGHAVIARAAEACVAGGTRSTTPIAPSCSRRALELATASRPTRTSAISTGSCEHASSIHGSRRSAAASMTRCSRTGGDSTAGDWRALSVPDSRRGLLGRNGLWLSRRNGELQLNPCVESASRVRPHRPGPGSRLA
jgi:hypothetical protein